MKKGWSSGKIVAVIFGSIGAAIILIVSLYASVYQLSKFIVAMNEWENAQYDFDEEDYEDWLNDNDYDEWLDEDDEDNDDGSYDDSEDDHADRKYYEFENAIRDDLSYQISMEEFYVEAENGLNATGYAEYPVITGEEVKNLGVINSAIQKELGVIEEHINEIAEYMSEEGSYSFETECYVTYMSEEIFSMVYIEYGYLDGDMEETYVVSVNIDMENGMVMTNTQLLEIDDDFSIDFRKRSDRQNGENELLDYYSDQDITEMMNDEDYLIIFYTPLGMEVGFNHYYGWVTVTYSDYKDYQNPL